MTKFNVFIDGPTKRFKVYVTVEKVAPVSFDTEEAAYAWLDSAGELSIAWPEVAA